MRIAQADVKAATDLTRFQVCGKYEETELRAARAHCLWLRPQLHSDRSRALCDMRVSAIETRLVDLAPASPLR